MPTLQSRGRFAACPGLFPYPCLPKRYHHVATRAGRAPSAEILGQLFCQLALSASRDLTGGTKHNSYHKHLVKMAGLILSSLGQKDNRPGDKFQLTFPLRTNYMYAKVKKSLPEMYAFTVCMWLKSSAAPGVGTPFSYAVPGQANELVLIEWGNNPMEILINDKVIPLSCRTRAAG